MSAGYFLDAPRHELTPDTGSGGLGPGVSAMGYVAQGGAVACPCRRKNAGALRVHPRPCARRDLERRRFHRGRRAGPIYCPGGPLGAAVHDGRADGHPHRGSASPNFRGVGEGGMIVAPPTVVNAIEDALTLRPADLRAALASGSYPETHCRSGLGLANTLTTTSNGSYLAQGEVGRAVVTAFCDEAHRRVVLDCARLRGWRDRR